MAAFGTVEYWRERADEARKSLKETSDPPTRSRMAEIIEVYDRLAKTAGKNSD